MEDVDLPGNRRQHNTARTLKQHTHNRTHPVGQSCLSRALPQPSHTHPHSLVGQYRANRHNMTSHMAQVEGNDSPRKRRPSIDAPEPLTQSPFASPNQSPTTSPSRIRRRSAEQVRIWPYRSYRSYVCPYDQFGIVTLAARILYRKERRAQCPTLEQLRETPTWMYTVGAYACYTRAIHMLYACYTHAIPYARATVPLGCTGAVPFGAIH